GPFAFAAAPQRLPKGRYVVEGVDDPDQATDIALGWALGCYRFDRYKSKAGGTRPTLVWPDGADRPLVRRLVRAIGFGRDLINTPAADLGPKELAAAARQVARAHGARCVVTSGSTLAKQYPAIHA